MTAQKEKMAQLELSVREKQIAWYSEILKTTLKSYVQEVAKNAGRPELAEFFTLENCLLWFETIGVKQKIQTEEGSSGLVSVDYDVDKAEGLGDYFGALLTGYSNEEEFLKFYSNLRDLHLLKQPIFIE